MSSNADSIRPGSIVSGPTFPEPIEVLATVPMGESLKVIGRGRNTGMTHDPVLTPAQLAQLTVSADREPFDGDARMFRLGVEAHRSTASNSLTHEQAFRHQPPHRRWRGLDDIDANG